ncbi:MAG: hypothetical protein EXR33_09545 [Betaproteobacteria bacterium]|nr:hypothetical protein [Betaproteobacteria bacterium]
MSIFLGRILIAILLNPPWEFDQLTKEQFERGDSYFVNFGRVVLVTIGTHIVEAGLVIAVLALVASHGVAFVQNYIRNGQYLKARVNQEIGHLMKRSAITFGAVFVLVGVTALGSPKDILAGVVLLKTGFEIWRYAHEHRAVEEDASGVS